MGFLKFRFIMTFPSKLLLFRIFFMLLISMKDEPKLNAAVNSSPSSWGKTWITMTQQSSTALSMERTSSSVWRTSGRPGKHQKVKKGTEPRNPFPGGAEFGLQVPWAGCAALRRVVLLFLPCTSLVLSSSLSEVWIPRISSGLLLPSSSCCTWAWPPKDQFLFCSSA